MTRKLISADDVLQAAPGSTLEVCAGTIITPLARDIARERDVQLVPTTAAQPSAAPPSSDPLEDRIRQAVAKVLGASAPASVRRPPVKLAKGGQTRMERFPFQGPPAGMDVHTADVVTAGDGSPMGAGYMSITKGAFEWEFSYDEVQVVLEGELVLGGDGGDQVGRAGDVFFIPKGSRIVFSTPTWARFVYVTHPADWGG